MNDVPFSHLYNAVVLPVALAGSHDDKRFQVSASRNDRGTPRYISAAWALPQLRAGFARGGVSEAEFQELLRGNRRASGGRDARRLLFTEEQLTEMGLQQDTPDEKQVPGDGQPSAGEHAVFPVTQPDAVSKVLGVASIKE